MNDSSQTNGSGSPVLGRITPLARVPLGALWLFAFVCAVGVHVGGLWIALAAEVPLDELLLQGSTGLVAAIALLTTALLLFKRDPGDPVAYLLSLSSLSAAAYVGAVSSFFYQAVGLEAVEALLPSLWIGLLVAALPAFPDGRYIPAWGRWLTILALPFTLLISSDVFVDDAGVDLVSVVLGFGVALIAIGAAIIRFRRTPASLERQQLKWAALGVGICIALLILAVGLSYAASADLFPEDWLPWLEVVYVAMHDLSFTVLALGILMSLLRLRLWDADRAIGRSAAYFILTLILACVWAVSSTLVNDFVSAQVGGSNKGTVAAISTIIAALVFGPARERVNKWVEARMQRGVVQLRGLPNRLAIWQHLDDPAAFGGRVASAVADSLHAGRCAVLLFEGNRFQPLACIGVSAQDVEEWIAGQGSFVDLAYEEPVDPEFPLRLILTDEDVLIGALLVGRRSDGSFFAKEERSTLLGLEPALAAALNRVHQRVATTRTLAVLDQRLERVEAVVAR